MSSLNARQRKALSDHAGVVIFDYYNGNPPPWSQIGTKTHLELRTRVIDRLHEKACGDVADILNSNAKELAVRAIQQRFKTLREKRKRDDKKKKADAPGLNLVARCTLDAAAHPIITDVVHDSAGFTKSADDGSAGSTKSADDESAGSAKSADDESAGSTKSADDETP